MLSELAGAQGRRALALASFSLISGAVLALALGAERIRIALTLSLLSSIFAASPSPTAALLLCGETRGPWERRVLAALPLPGPWFLGKARGRPRQRGH